ncbi:MAG TPA: 4-hydroxy-tetrahydrodipicolinate reductase [Clostridiaceae bacterium]|nr:4-hydroxy-tetrahydrodipicolinate reductase [Clostridiaceae bacterium]
MINILMSGCNGKMGQVISKTVADYEDMRIVAGYDIRDDIISSYPVFTDLNKVNVKVDVIIDFSNPDALEKILDFALKKHIALVVATTGLSSLQKTALETAAAKIPVFFSANMSLGVNLLMDLVKKAAKTLENNFDIEIVEKHHNQKLDAPSGTALAIADAINSVLEQRKEYTYDRHSRRKKRNKDEIGIHAIRGGTIVGEHEVIFAGNDEIIEIKHIALSKNVFAVGALEAARFISKKSPGLYNMTDLVSD